MPLLLWRNFIGRSREHSGTFKAPRRGPSTGTNADLQFVGLRVPTGNRGRWMDGVDLSRRCVHKFGLISLSDVRSPHQVRRERVHNVVVDSVPLLFRGDIENEVKAEAEIVQCCGNPESGTGI
jgi:hypothetical protein